VHGLVRRHSVVGERDRMTKSVQFGGAFGGLRRSLGASASPIGPCRHRASVNTNTLAFNASISGRIESRLTAIAEHEAAIRAELALLANLDDGRLPGALLTVQKAADFLGVSRATVFRLMTDDPDLVFLKINHRTLFRPEDLTAYAAAKVSLSRVAS
jgi:hypothetical protein